MLVTSLTYVIDMAMSQALALTGDLKLGWYTSIPPREMFACQILGTIIGCFTNCQLDIVLTRLTRCQTSLF